MLHDTLLHASKEERAQRPRAASKRIIRLTQIDGGGMPNLALMKLAHWHKAQGDAVHFSRHVQRDFVEPTYDRVYASTIFTESRPLVEQLQREFPGAIVGGTGIAGDPGWKRTVEEIIGVPAYPFLD